jgi:hypothetical protein
MMALFLLTTCRNIWHPQDPIFWSGYLRLSMLKYHKTSEMDRTKLISYFRYAHCYGRKLVLRKPKFPTHKDGCRLPIASTVFVAFDRAG